MNMKVVIITILVLALLGGGGYYFLNRSQNAAEKTAEEVTPTPEESTPTPEEVDKSAFTIEVQNGSGIEGEAGRAKELLEGADFTVDSTANAPNYDYEETVIQAGEDVSEEWLDALKETLEEQYTVQSSVEEIDGDTDADVVVIVGSLDDNGDSMVKEEESKDTSPTPADEEEESVSPSPSPSPTETP